MSLTIYQVDAFTDKLFHGNPAAVCITDNWLSDDLMQNIAAENNLAETAFVVPHADHFLLRWFTPVTEVDLCGHATLASAFVIFNHTDYYKNEIIFESPRSGILKVKRNNDLLTLDFPADVIEPVDTPKSINEGLGKAPLQTYKGKSDYMCIFNSEEEIIAINADFKVLSKIPQRGIIITARGNNSDFVSRFFAPQFGIDEDPVTGSAHTTLTPYWSKEIGKQELTAVQLSKRRGYLTCRDMGSRVEISGHAVLYMKAEIEVSL